MSLRRLVWFLAASFALALKVGPAFGELAVTGSVLAVEGHPLAGARVELLAALPAYADGRRRLGAAERPVIADAETDAEGRFRLAAPARGALAVSVRAWGRAPMVFGPFLLTRALELAPLAMPRAIDTTVRVLDAGDRPVAGAWLVAEPPAVEAKAPQTRVGWRLEPRFAQASLDGSAVLPVLEGERLTLDVFLPGDPRSRRAVVTGGIVRVPRGAALATSLHVTLASGQPAEGVLLRTGARGLPVGVTDALGTLALELPAGVTLRGELVPREGSPQAVQLKALGSQPLVIALPPAFSASGRILDAATGRGLQGALVALAADLGAVVSTDERGRFSLPVPDGPAWGYEVHAPGYLPRRVRVRRTQIASGRLPAVSLEPAARVMGRAMTLNGQPLAGVAIEAVSEGTLADRPFTLEEPVADRVVSDPEGRFELPGLRPANGYELRARKEGYLPAAIPVVTASTRAKPPVVELKLQPTRAAVGKVVDGEGRPLPGARVVLRPSRRPDRRPPERQADNPPPKDGDPASAESGRDGRFLIPRCPAAELDVEARLEGFAPTRRVGFHVGPETAPLDLGILVLRPGARLVGRVVSDRGRPLAGAEVFLFDRLPTRAGLDGVPRGREPDATAGADGAFVLADLPPGLPQNLLILAERFMPATVRGVRPPVDRPLLVRLKPGFQVSGKVLDEQGQPVPGAEASLTSQQVLEGDPHRRPLGKPVFRQAVTDASGRFLIRDAPQGPAMLGASAEGFVPVEPVEIELPFEDPPKPVELRLRRGAVVWGRVSTMAGHPVAGARILAGDASGSSDAEGSYRVAGVAEGEQTVEVRHPSYRRLARTAEIEPGENRLDFEVPAGVSVEGRVVEPSGEPVDGADVGLSTEDRRERQEYRAKSDTDGRFRLEPVAAGIYHLQATAPDRASGELPEPVVVAQEPIHRLEVVVERGARLWGKVLGLTSDELATVSIEARGEDGRLRGGRLDATGRYEVRALPPGGWLVRAVLWQGQREARARIAVGPADRELTRDLEFGRGLTLSGVVLFDEQPLQDATLTVRGQRFALERAVLTAFDGGFRLEDLEPDLYRLGISKPDQLIAHNQWLEVADDRELEIHLSAATVAGVVRDAKDGRPIASAFVRLVPVEGPEFVILDSSQEDGSFRLLRVPPGSYRLRVSADGFVGAEQGISVAAGEALGGLEFALQPTGGGLLQVALATGEVPPMVHLLALDAAGVPVTAETRLPDAAGQVRLATLPPGEWQLLVSAPGGATVSRTIVVPGETIPVTFPPAGRLQVQVPALAATDRLATASLFGSDQQALAILGPGGQLQMSWLVKAGQATIEGVPQGVWLVRVESTDGRLWSGPAVTTGSRDAAVRLE